MQEERKVGLYLGRFLGDNGTSAEPMRNMFKRSITWYLPVWGAVCGSAFTAFAASVSDYAVGLSATALTNPPRVSLSWPADPAATSCVLYRKPRDGTDWGTEIPLAAATTHYVDSNVVAGGAWEYQVCRTTPSYSSYGYIYAGVEVPLVEFRGKVILVVDSSLASSLTTELARLEQDLTGDGWTVLRHDVPRMAVPPAATTTNVWAARSNELASVKALIRADYNADPGNVRTVFLLGHLPVPYSGDLGPDGHPEHTGAWPADAYYANLAGAWTDSSRWDQGASDTRNWNVPGDGKLDPSWLPSDVDLQIGRVDLANLPAFAAGETNLVRQYLNKNHRFRHKVTWAERRGWIDDNFGVSGAGAPVAVNGWRNFAPFFGASNVFAGPDWFGTLATNSYLWGYGCGAGTFTTCSGVGSTANFAASDPRVVFTMFFGSYFGDWDSENNFLRAALGTPNYTLTSAWVGRPYWQFHHMALGEPIGFSTRLTQNNSSIYASGTYYRRVHVALMGDPTLRMHPVAPATNLAAVANGSGGVDLSWGPSPDTVAGYHVYRATNGAGPFERLNSTLISDTHYSDPVTTTTNYMVRAVKLEVSASGSYWNASQGIFAGVQGGSATNAPPVAGPDTLERRLPNGVKVTIQSLLSNDVDPEGDRITFLGVSAASSHGGTVMINGDWVCYWPASGYADADTFNYSITDGTNLPVTGTVTVLIRGNEDLPPNLLVLSLGGGSYQVVGDGLPGCTYRIEFTDALDHPAWQTLGAATADSFGVFTLTDTPGAPQRFYRSVYP